MWERDDHNRLVRQALDPTMNRDQNPPEDAGDNFDNLGDDLNVQGGANPNVQRERGPQDQQRPNPRMNFPPPINEGNHFQVDPPARSMRDFLQPTRSTTPSCILLPVQAHLFQVKPGMLQLLPTFRGIENQNPYLHIREFEDIVATFNANYNMEEIARLKLFPFSLSDRAKSWLYDLRSRSITTWAQMVSTFLNKIFLVHRTSALKKEIQNFSKKPNEQFYQCWDRYKELL